MATPPKTPLLEGLADIEKVANWLTIALLIITVFIGALVWKHLMQDSTQIEIIMEQQKAAKAQQQLQ